MTQTLYAHMNIIKKRKINKASVMKCLHLGNLGKGYTVILNFVTS
jgi:hypothetical protein